MTNLKEKPLSDDTDSKKIAELMQLTINKNCFGAIISHEIILSKLRMKFSASLMKLNVKTNQAVASNEKKVDAKEEKRRQTAAVPRRIGRPPKK